MTGAITAPEARFATRPRRARVGSHRLRWWGVYSLAALVGLVWVLALEPMQAPDESTHTVRAVGVSRGEWQTSYERGPGFWGASIPRTTVRVPEAYAHLNALRRCEAQDGIDPADCPPPLPPDAGPIVDAVTHVGTYQHTYYLAVGWPSRFLRPGAAIVAMRALGAMVCAALAASAVAALADRRGAVGVAGFLLAATPTALSLSGAVNPNGVEIFASLAVWASFLDLFSRTERPPTRIVVRAVAATVVLAAVRPLSPAFLAVILAVAALASLRRSSATLLLRDRRLWRAAAIVGVVAAASTVFVVVNGSTSALIEWPTEPAGTMELVREQLGRTWFHLEQAVGLLGPVGAQMVSTPALLWQAWVALAAGLAVAAFVVGSWQERLALLAAAAGSLVLPVLAHVANPAASWQGRYALPLLGGVPMLAGWVLGRPGRLNRSTTVGLALAVASLFTVVQVVALGQMLGTNAGAAPPAFLRWWRPALRDGLPDPRMLGALGVAALTGIGVLLVGSAWRPRPVAAGPT